MTQQIPDEMVQTPLEYKELFKNGFKTGGKYISIMYIEYMTRTFPFSGLAGLTLVLLILVLLDGLHAAWQLLQDPDKYYCLPLLLLPLLLS